MDVKERDLRVRVFCPEDPAHMSQEDLGYGDHTVLENGNQGTHDFEGSDMDLWEPQPKTVSLSSADEGIQANMALAGSRDCEREESRQKINNESHR
jgi:hypothetical protein